MCKTCKKKTCPGCGGSTGKDIAQLDNRLLELENRLEEMEKNTKWLTGHPILCLDQDSDINLFDFTSGLGEDKWDGWALCNGMQQYSESDKANMTMANLLDKFIVGAGDTYAVREVGGAATVQLTVAELPVHNHVLTDPGHSHDIEDPGHNHGTTQEEHNHGAVGASHSHGIDLETSLDPGHEHHTGFTVIGDNNTGSNFNALNDGTSGSSTSTDGAHSHTVTGSTASASVAVTVEDASINITVDNAFTGIGETQEDVTGITLADTGEDQAHENRPPFYAVIFIQKL